MRQRKVGDGLDFCHVQYPEVGLPLVEPIKRIVIGAEEVRHPALPSNGAVEHATKCDTIDHSRMDAEANDPARVLIHDLCLAKTSSRSTSHRINNIPVHLPWNFLHVTCYLASPYLFILK